MNRHGYHNEHECEEDCNVEMPLPTYEEVVDAANHNIGFKADVLMPPVPSSYGGSRAGSSVELPRERAARPSDEEMRAPNYYDERRKSCGKGSIVVIFGMVFIPLVIVFVVLHLKTCRTCEPFKEVLNEDNTAVKFNAAELEHCNNELQKTSERYRELLNNLQSVKRERDELLVQQENADEELKKLRYNYNTAFSDATNLQAEVSRLRKQIEEYKLLEKNFRSALNKRH